MNKESSIKQLKRIKQDMTHADDVNALDYAIRYMENKELKQIRAEIDGSLSDGMIHKKTVLGIIDKYREG